jgi:hypothetical protein
MILNIKLARIDTNKAEFHIYIVLSEIKYLHIILITIINIIENIILIII